ncbi:uncharacterized protein [Haliotis asinina]|uniref:uncharacterized protein n=1 Tax=Haliotis asinina TaxID=109174 RepID=UPI0035325A40
MFDVFNRDWFCLSASPLAWSQRGATLWSSIPLFFSVPKGLPNNMSEICPHCGVGFKRLASHEWRCKEKKTTPSSSSNLKCGSSSSAVGRSGSGRPKTPSAAGQHKMPSAGNSSGAGRHNAPSADNITGAWRPTTSSTGNSSGNRGHLKPSDTVGKTSAVRSSVSESARRHNDQKPTEIVVKICPDCGANYRYKHEVCHARGSGKRDDKAAYDVKTVCPDCGRSYKFSHKVCRGRQKSDPVSQHRVMIPNRPNDPITQQSTRRNYTPRLEHEGREAYGYENDFDEPERLAAAFEASVNVKETHARRHRHRGNKAVYCGGLSEGDALADAFKARLNLKKESWTEGQMKEAAPLTTTTHLGKPTMHPHQRSVKPKSAAKSVPGAAGERCRPPIKPSVSKIPQVNCPSQSKDHKPGLSPSKDTKQPQITAPGTFRKEERSEPSSKQCVSKRGTNSSSDTVKYPKVTYPPLDKDKKREQVKDTSHPPSSCARLGTLNRDSRGTQKSNPLHTSPITEDTTLLKDQSRAARHRQTKSMPVAKLNAYHSEKINEGSPTRPSKKTGSDENQIKPDGDLITKGSPEKEHDEDIFSTSDLNLKMSIIKNSVLCKTFKSVGSFCFEKTLKIIVLLKRIYCLLPELPFHPFAETNRRKCPDKPNLSHSHGEHKDITMDTSQMDALVAEMVDKQIIRNSDNPNRDIKNFFEKEVKMEKENIAVALGHFRRLRGKIIGLLNSEMTFGTWTFCNAGSHFDGTKVARPNEFDCTIFPDLQTKLVAEFDDTCEAGACKVKVVGDVNDHETDLQLFLEGSYVNSKKFKEYVFEKLERVLQSDRKLKDARKFAFTQSFAVSYEGIPTEEGMKSIDIDFVPSLNIKPWPPRNISRDINKVIPDKSKATAVQRNGFNVTAKHWYHANDPHLLWQVSFSYAEKIITKYADKVAWKPTLRTLKRVLEIAKGKSDSCAKSNNPELLQIQKAVQYVQEQNLDLRSSRLSTYHIRTLMWWQLYELTVGEHVWREETMATRFQESLRKFQKMMTGEIVVPHFFLPQIKNILPHRLAKERLFLYVIARATEVIFTKKK